MFFVHSTSDFLPSEKENSMECQVAALQQAVALMQMGNMFDTQSKRNAEDKMTNPPSNIFMR